MSTNIYEQWTIEIRDSRCGVSGTEYDIGLCGRVGAYSGTAAEAHLISVSGTACRDDERDVFHIKDDGLKHLKAMSSEDAKALLAAVFEDTGRGAAFEDGFYCYRPLADLDEFLVLHVYRPQSLRIARILRRPEVT